MSTLLMLIGGFALLWWLFGLALVAFACQTYVEPSAPLSARLQTLFTAGFAMPWMLLTMGQLPIVMLMPANPTPEQDAAFEKWRMNNCNCPECKARRGER